MRLSILDNGHRLRAKLFLSTTARMSGAPAADVPKMLLYRPEFFGRAMLDLSAELMRGPSFWTAGEREYFAMTTARAHSCPFCVVSHTELVRIASAGEIDAADPDSTRPEVTAAVALLEKLATAPDRVGRDDLERVRAAGAPDPAIVDALHVNLIWNVVNRLANVFGFELREGQLEAGTKALHRFGYRFPGFLVSGGKTRRETGGERHARLVANLRHAVLESPGHTDPATRAAAAAAGAGDPPPEPWPAYVDLVRDRSFLASAEDIERLRAAGQSEDAIFEITVAAAVGAGLRSLDAGLSAMA